MTQTEVSMSDDVDKEMNRLDVRMNSLRSPTDSVEGQDTMDVG